MPLKSLLETYSRSPCWLWTALLSLWPSSLLFYQQDLDVAQAEPGGKKHKKAHEEPKVELALSNQEALQAILSVEES